MQPRCRREGEGRAMLKRYFRFYMVLAGLLLVLPSQRTRNSAAATIVFDPTMYAASCSSSAGDRDRHQPGSAAPVHDQEHHRRRRRSLAVQPEPAHQSGRADFRAAGPFLHLSGPRAAVPAALSRLQRDQHAGRAKPAGERRHHAQYPERRAPERASRRPRNFKASRPRCKCSR